MPIDKKEILKRVENLEKEDVDAKDSRKDRKKFWKEHSLEESLYNTVDGKRIPRAQDVDQSSCSNLNYIFKRYGIGDCYLLSALMGVAKDRPNVIMQDLIKIKNKDLVEVRFFDIKFPPIVKVKAGTVSVMFEPEGQRALSYTVGKEEAIKWKTSHRALWVVVAEVAYAKYLRDTDCQNRMSSYVEYKMIDLPTESLNFSTPNCKELRKILGEGGEFSIALTNLVGSKSKVKTVKTFNLKKIKGNKEEENNSSAQKYSSAAINIYNKIQKKIAAKRLISVSFGGSGAKIGKDEIALEVIKYSKELKRAPRDVARFLKCYYWMDEDKCNEWLGKHELSLEELAQSSDALRKEFVLDLVNFENKNKISKNSSGIEDEHAYLVLGVLEHKGYKYVVLKNPHKMETKIDYYNKKKNGIPKEVGLPSQIDKEKNECMMELNHFCKKLSSISYDK